MNDHYWPTDVDRIEVRILIPLPDDTPDPQALAKQVNDRIGEVALSITDLPFWFVAEVRPPDKGLFDPPAQPSLTVVPVEDDA